MIPNTLQQYITALIIDIRPKPITEFDSVEDLQRWLERQKQPESAQEIRRREQRDQQIIDVLSRYPNRIKGR